MTSRRLTSGIFAVLSIMLVALFVLIERGGSSNVLRNAAMITFIVSAVPVSDKMGFIVTTPHIYPLPTVDKQPLLLTPPAEGYFMVHTGNGWQRLTIKDPLKGPGTAG
jgi:hypothetical protein